MTNVFAQLKAEQAMVEVQENLACSIFLKAYGTFVKASVWMKRNRQTATVWDRQRFWQLERRIASLWGNLGEKDRVMVTDVLFPAGTMVRATLEVFRGKVVSLI